MSNAWTTVGKGGKPVSFPPEAMAAFGSKRSGDRMSRTEYRPSGGRSEFPAEAASAFGRPAPRGGSGFDGDAQSAFGSRRPHRGPEGFDATASAAFGGGRRGDFPDAFGGRPARRPASDYPHRYGGSSAPVVPVPPPAPKQTFEEMFPALGSPATKAPAPAATVGGASTPKASFADLMRRHAEKDAHDTAEAERRTALAREAREKEEKERALLRRLHRARTAGAYNAGKYATDTSGYDDEEDYGDDLDHDGYGVVQESARPAPSYSHLLPDEEPEGEDEWETA